MNESNARPRGEPTLTHQQTDALRASMWPRWPLSRCLLVAVPLEAAMRICSRREKEQRSCYRGLKEETE